MIQRQAGLVLTNQPDHLPGNRAHINDSRAHAENCCNKFLVGQGGSTPFPQFLARTTVFGQVLDSFHIWSHPNLSGHYVRFSVRVALSGVPEQWHADIAARFLAR